MAYREVEPHPALQPFVDRLWMRDGLAGPGGGESAETARILPDGCIDLLLSLDGGPGVAVGTMTRASEVEVRPGHRVVAVRFRPAGAAPFLRVAAHELTDRRVRLDDLGLPWLRDRPLDPRLSCVAALATLERALLARLPAVSAPERRVAAAVRALFGEAPPAVEPLARDLGISRQHLGRAFRDQVGVGPKLLARIARVQRAVRCLQGGQLSSLAQAAAAAGYFDEAHMDRDFRELVGVTPGQAQASPATIRPIPSLLSGLDRPGPAGPGRFHSSNSLAVLRGMKEP
jgi:AraC-like DNA-binding protein